MRHWAAIPDGLDVLMTHGPPTGYGDKASPGGGRRIGCESLLASVERAKPAYHVFGHVHSGYGVCANDSTTFVNASTCTHAYRPTNPPIVFDLPPRAASYVRPVAGAMIGSADAAGGAVVNTAPAEAPCNLADIV